MSRIANNALLGGGVRVRVWIRGQRKIKRRSKVLLSLCWQSWTSLRESEKERDGQREEGRERYMYFTDKGLAGFKKAGQT